MTPMDELWFHALIEAHTPEGIALVRQHGLEPARKAGHVGVAHGHFDGRWWRPDTGGQELLVALVFDPLDGWEIDVLAIDPDDESIHHLMTGLGVMLGEPPFFDEIRLYRTATDWLKAGCDGIYIVNWEAVRPFLTGSPALRLICQDMEHAVEVKRHLWLQMPRLVLETDSQLDRSTNLPARPAA